MQSKNFRGTRFDHFIAEGENSVVEKFSPEPNGALESIPIHLDLKSEFKEWRRANRIHSRHWLMAEQLGGRAMRAVRWERGMVMLRGIHIEIAQRKI